MNRFYRVVFNARIGVWQAVTETARSRGKSGGRVRLQRALLAGVALAPLVALAGPAPTALPAGGTVTNGTGSISQSGSTLTVNQQSQNLSLGWQSFNIGSQATVNFVQPDASAIAVNRVSGTDGSKILGNLNANGQVYLINPNGVLFGRGAQVNVGGLVASTLDVSDSDLGTDTLVFSGSGTGAVVNKGHLTAAPGGTIALLGNKVINEGVITAQLGSVALAGGSAMTLSFDGDRLVSLEVNQSTLDTLAKNGELIVADGGTVLMTAGARDSLLASVVNNTGTIQAQTVSNQGGTITLLAGMTAGTVKVGGTLDASAPDGGNGGSIETSGSTLTIAPGATITAAAPQGKGGTWLVDPDSLTIDSTAATTIDNTLNDGTSVTEQTTSSGVSGTGTTTSDGEGNIYVTAPLSWSTGATLALSAYNSIDIGAPVTVTGLGGLVLTTNTGGNTTPGTLNFTGGSVQFTSATPSLTALTINGNSYTLIQNVNQLQAMSSNLAGHYALAENLDASTTTGFTPIGESTAFTGTFDGLGNTISNLVINDAADAYVGLFGQVGSGGTVENVGLVGGSVSGGSDVDVGGLAGVNFGTITDAYATGAVSGSGGDDGVGGLVGVNDEGTITNAYATGAVTGTAIGAFVGGLVGSNDGTITDAYATGAVTGSSGADVGGLVGYNDGTITNAYATGAVSGGNGAVVGGLVGYNYRGPITDGYWDTETTGQKTSSRSSDTYGLTTTELETVWPSGFSTSVWGNANNQTTPYLLGLAGNQVFVQGAGNTLYTVIQNVNQLQAMSSNLAGDYVLGNAIDASATASWNSGAGFEPVGESTAFTGTFDGLGNTISNLVITDATDTYVGLFGVVGSGGTVENVGLVGGSVTGGGSNAYVGGLVGVNFGTITDAYATGAVTGTAAEGNANVGGLVGYNGGTITDAYATGAVTGTADPGNANVGGLVGFNYGGTITNAYATGAVTGSGLGADVGGLVGLNDGDTITDGYWDTETTGQSSSSGGDGLTTTELETALPSGFSTSVWGNANNQTTPYLLGLAGNQVFVQGAVNTLYTVIQNVNQLQAMSSNLAGDYVLGNAIDASATASWNSGAGFEPVGESTAFTGVFDGLGNTISNLAINDADAYVGLFGVVGSGGTVENVGLVGGSVMGTANSADVGGLVGENYGTITNAYATGAVTGSGLGADVGGLVGFNDGGTITNAYATGAVTGSGLGADVGGLVGWNYEGPIEDAYATGAVTGSGLGADVGGLVGLNDGDTITDGYWDTGTTGQSSSAGSSTGGENTTTLQVDLPTGFLSTTWGIVAGKSYPYLLTQFATGATPQVISGTVYTDGGSTAAGAGVTVSGLLDGSALASVLTGGAVQTGANGYYYYLLAPGTLASDGSNVLTYAQNYGTGSNLSGATFVDQTATSGSVLNIDAGTLDIPTPATQLSTVLTDLANTEGSGATQGTALSAAPVAGLTVDIDASGAFTVDTAATVSGALEFSANGAISETAGGALTVDGASTFDAGSNAITLTNAGNRFGGAVSLTGGTTQITDSAALTLGTLSTGALTATGTGNLDLGGGTVDGTLTATSNGGAISQDNALSVTGASTLDAGTSAITLTNAGNSFGGALTATGTGVSLYGTGNLDVASLTDEANGNVSLTAGGTLSVAGVAAGSGNVTLASDGGPLAPTGTVSGDNVALTGADGVTLADSVTTTGTLSLTGTNTPIVQTTGAVTTGGAVTVDAGSGAITLTNTDNRFGGAVSSSGGVTQIVNDTALTLGTVSATTLLAQTTSGNDLSIASGGQVSATGTGDAIVLASGGTFTNDAGSTALNAANGNWLIWSQNPANDTLDGLAYGFRQYDATYGTSTVLGTGNGVLYTLAPVLTVGLTGTVSKTYDGTTTATLDSGNYAVSGLVGSDTAVLVEPTTGQYATPDAGTGETVTASGISITGVTDGSVPVYGYQLASTTASGAIGTITPATLTYVATAASSTYGGTPTDLTGTVTGFVDGQTLASATTGTATFTTSATAGSNVGSYAITGSGLSADNGNYEFVQAAGNANALTVNPAALTITASNQTKTYGNTLSLGTTAFTESGLVNGDTVTGVSLASAGTAATATVSGGPYAITVSDATGSGLSNNYTITYVNGSLTVNPALLTITASNQTKTYGNTLSLGTTAFTTSGLVNSDTVTGVNLASSGAAATATVSGGPYAITVSDATGSGLSNNYTITYVNGSLTVNPALLTITASNQTKTYGNTLSLGTTAFTTSGLVNSDTVTGVNLASSGAAATATVSGGPYAITVSDATGSGLSNNYTITYVNGSLTVNPASLTITASNQTKTYGTTASLGTTAFTTSGLVNSDTVTGVSLASAGTAATVTVSGGPYAITVSDATGSGLSNNYTITYVNGSLTVNPASLIVTASNQAKTYGTTASLGTTAFTTSGLVNSDTVTGVNLASSGAAATATVSGGPYAITVSDATGSGLSNYTITYVNGSLTVNPASLIVTASNQAKTYGTTASLGTTAFTTSGLVNSDTVTGVSLASAGTAATASVSGGPYAITAGNATGTGLSNYTITYANGSLTVNPAVLVASLTGSIDQVYDGTTSATLAADNFTLAGILNGDTVSLNDPSSGSYATKNVGTGIDVSVNGLALTGPAAGNYVLASTSASAPIGTITPATLTYAATATQAWSGQILSGLGGTVTGFVGGDTLASSTTGTLTWTTPATRSSPPGSYAIDGSGLAADNGDYVLVQAPGNATALDVRMDSLPGVVATLQRRLETNGDVSPGSHAAESVLPGIPPDLAPPSLTIINGGVNMTLGSQP